MLRSYKTEINPTNSQKQIINRTIGTCRFIYNLFIAHNKEIYESEKRYVSGYEFAKWINNVFVPNNRDYQWIKNVSTKSVKQSIMNADTAYRKFFKGLSNFPKFKKKKNNDVKMYFVKSDANTVIPCERHRIKIPTLGWVQLKEKGYIPSNGNIKSGTISIQAGRYFASVLVDEEVTNNTNKKNTKGVGIDLGIKEFAVCSNGSIYNNINKTAKIRGLEKRLRRNHRKISRQYKEFIKRNEKMKGEATRQNISKQLLKVQKIYNMLNNIRIDFQNKVINELVKNKPVFIALEDLNVEGMLKNKHISKSVANLNFSAFKKKLINKCIQNGIEVRIVDRWYPSSKMCHNCGNIKRNLKLFDRTYICECGYVEDRDLNASLNLRDALTYRVA